MDSESEEWRKQAEEFARAAGEELTALEHEIESASAAGSFRTVWDHIRSLGERIRSAPAIQTPDKIELQRRLNAVVRRAKDEQKRVHQATEQTRDDIMSRLQLASEAIRDGQTVADIQEVRADLNLLRERISGLNGFPRALRTQIWTAWQDINRLAWEALVSRWEANEQTLSEMLDSAEEALEHGQTRQARDLIKGFHEGIASHEPSHRGARALRSRANAIWQRSVERGREQREQYVAAARRRVDRWRGLVRRNDRTRAQLTGRIAALERQVATAHTDVGHALAVGQLSEAQRELERLEADDRRLRRQIEESEATLGEESTQAT